jgi:hypothetical protein
MKTKLVEGIANSRLSQKVSVDLTLSSFMELIQAWKLQKEDFETLCQEDEFQSICTV